VSRTAIRHGSTVRDGRTLFAEYPFLPGAESLLGTETVSIRALLEDPAYERARSIGRSRILAAADDPRATRDVAELDAAEPEVRYLSLLFDQIVLAAATSSAALRRWAVAEAKRAHIRLASVPTEELVEVATGLGVTMEARPDDRVALRLVDYLHLAVPIREADYRLARQEVEHGAVVVGRVRGARILQEAVRGRLATPLPLAEDVRARVRDRESELLESIAQRMPAPVARPSVLPGSVRPELFPPCIRKMRRMLEAGENLSHAGRFALAAFLHRVGADFETIVDAYRGAPDFDESITRYQVEHITHRDGGVGYEPPECDTLRSHGLCFRDGDPTAPRPADRERDPRCFDPHLRHPLQYYRQRGGPVVDRRPPEERPEPSPPGATPGTPATPGRPRSPGPR
jgi:DNA primase large subunit